MAIFRKIPVEIKAFKLGFDSLPDWFLNKMSNNKVTIHPLDNIEESKGPFTERKIYANIKTLEGEMNADFGDYIIQGVDGEIYPCKPEIFKKTYEFVKEE